MKSNSNVKITRDLKTPETVGVHHRLLCMTGKNKGFSYYLKGIRAILGRGDDVDVQVLDTKSSREHAELTLHGGKYVLTDLGSQNGVTVNDLKVNQHTLEDGDRVIIGQTVFKYSVLKVESDLSLVEESDEESELYEYEEEVVEKKKKKKGSAEAEKEKKKKIIYAVVGLAVIFLIFGDGEKELQEDSTKEGSGSEGTSIGLVDRQSGKSLRDIEQERKLNAVLHRGLREFREGNFFRAIAEFNFALLIAPNHGRASFYLARTQQRLDEEIELNFTKARQEVGALKYDAAIISYCSVIRLLRDYPEDERYIEAEKQIDRIEEKMGYLANEDSCFSRQ
jgi:tetratricopeptide (TPR) repeat protein